MSRVRKFDRFMVDVNVGTNRKLRRLTVPERWCYIAGILPIAAQAPVRGRLLIGDLPAEEADYAEQAGVTVTVARQALGKLRELGVIYLDEELGCEQVHDFEDWNPPPKEDATNAERQRRYRERHSSGSNATSNGVTDNAVTLGREVEVEGKEQQRTSSLRSNDVEPTRLDQAKTRLKDNAVHRVFDAWQTARTELTGHPSAVVLTDSRRRLITRRLKEWPELDLIDATQGWLRSPHHRGENDRHTVYGDLELVLRDAAHIERFRDLHRNEAARPGARQSRNVVDLMPANRDPDTA